MRGTPQLSAQVPLYNLINIIYYMSKNIPLENIVMLPFFSLEQTLGIHTSFIPHCILYNIELILQRKWALEFQFGSLVKA